MQPAVEDSHDQLIVKTESSTQHILDVDLRGVVADIQRILAPKLIKHLPKDLLPNEPLNDVVTLQLPLEFSGCRLSSDANSKWETTGICDGAKLSAFESELQDVYEQHLKDIKPTIICEQIIRGGKMWRSEDLRNMMDDYCCR